MRKEEFIRLTLAALLSAVLYWNGSDYLVSRIQTPSLLVNGGFLLAAGVYMVFQACYYLFKK